MKTPSTFLRKLNERRLLNAVRLGERVSRADLERQLSLAAPTISRIVDRLLEDGWLRELGFGDTSSGRKPMLIDINPRGIGVLGVELGRGTTRVVYTNLLAEVQAQEERDGLIKGPDALSDYLVAFMQRHGLTGEKLVGVGIAAPGASVPNKDMIIPTPEVGMDWFEVPIVDIVSERLNVPAFLANDANAAALGETWFGSARDARHAAFILFDVGVGAGLAVNGSIYEGVGQKAGEFSHAIVNVASDDQCDEGHYGCVDSAASEKAILAQMRRIGSVPEGETVVDMIRKAKDGQVPEKDVIDKAITYLAAGVVNLIRMFDPQIVVLGGRTLLSDAYVVTETKRRVNRLLLPEQREVTVSSFGLFAVAIGAAAIVLQTIYDHTQLVELG